MPSKIFFPFSRLGYIDHIGYEYLPALEGRYLQICFDRIQRAVLSPVHAFDPYFFTVAGNQRFDFAEEVRREVGVYINWVEIEKFIGCISEVESGAFIHLEELVRFRIENINLVERLFEDVADT